MNEFNVHRKPETPEDENTLLTLVRNQVREINKDITMVTCPCGKTIRLVFGYKCLYCGLVFCLECARIHFKNNDNLWEDGAVGTETTKRNTSESGPITSIELLQIEMAAFGTVSNTLAQWPYLRFAMHKATQYWYSDSMSSPDIQKECKRILSGLFARGAGVPCRDDCNKCLGRGFTYVDGGLYPRTEAQEELDHIECEDCHGTGKKATSCNA